LISSYAFVLTTVLLFYLFAWTTFDKLYCNSLWSADCGYEMNLMMMMMTMMMTVTDPDRKQICM